MTELSPSEQMSSYLSSKNYALFSKTSPSDKSHT